ncbi:TIGR02302 family protein [Sagittula sp. S175]|uniref:TIGR02302 family protein n=1 Tax=Sagittula sp. S175 TaxID=3415129 RepID=UPI003C7C8032
MARKEPRHTPNSERVTGLIRWPLRLTRSGMVAEAVTRAFWPLWSVLFVVLALLMLGVQDEVAVEWVWGVGAVLAGLGLWALWRGVRMFRWPSEDAALVRLDQAMKGRPIQALLDRQAIGGDDPASLAVWKAHQARMQARLRDARAVEPDLRVSRADPFALRYVAVLGLAVALLFGSFGRVQSVTNMGVGGGGLAEGPAWEGWMQPPAYTRLPSVYLNDITDPELSVPEGAAITLRMYGQVGALTVEEDVSDREVTPEMASATAQDFEVARSGRLAIEGPGGREWQVAMVPDAGPSVAREGEIETSYEGEAKIPFRAQDDHGVVTGVARITLDLGAVDRRWGRALEPEPQEVIEVPLPMPVAGDRTDFVEPLVANFSLHPWANLPVRMELEVQDARGQSALSQPEEITLPGRRFFDPVAAALIEERQALLWNRDYAREAAMILRAVLNRSDALFRKPEQAETLRGLMERIEAGALDGMSDEAQAEITQALWDLALELEEGDLEDARQRMQRAQERLEEAMKNGASDQEIAELMQELREATRDYMRQLAQEQAKRGEQEGQPQNPQDMIEMSQDDIQRMMDRIQELMEEGRMAEAQEAMRQLQEMLENMQMTQGQGQGQSPGEQAMEGLSETLRDQQELSDEAFRELNQGQQGQQQGQQQQPGEGQQQGQQQGQQPGSGQDGQPGQGQQGQSQNGQSLADSLAERQRSLRDELNRQRNNLPGQGSEAGEEAGRALERAEGAMDGAERALRDGALGEAIDQQSQALEALREGMRSLGEALAEQQQQQGQQRSGQQGFAEGGDPQEQRDPLGRNAGTTGRTGTDEGLLQGEDVYRRAEELLGELRKRSGETERPEVERDYLERLLERF